MSDTDQIKSLARQLLEDDISRGDEAVAERIIHPDFVDHTNPPGMQHGLAATRRSSDCSAPRSPTSGGRSRT
jgi:hypothetical protein